MASKCSISIKRNDLELLKIMDVVRVQQKRIFSKDDIRRITNVLFGIIIK